RPQPGSPAVGPAHECASQSSSCPLTFSSTSLNGRNLELAQRLRCRHGAQHGFGLVLALPILCRRVGIRNDTRTGLHVHGAILVEPGADRNRLVGVAGKIEIADRAAVDTATGVLEAVD